MKFKVLVTRTVRYSTEVDVMASGIAEARDKAAAISQEMKGGWEQISDDHFPIVVRER